MVQGEDAVGCEQLLQQQRGRADLARRVLAFLVFGG